MASSGTGRVQRRMGPAPFASLEDLSDEADTSPTEPPPVRLPGIHEDGAGAPPRPCCAVGGLTPGTPRIDISRASSSSHHEDSRDSTPERELFQGPGGKACARLGVAFTEEGALELRSSTEELDFHEERRRDANEPTDEHQQHRQQQQRHRSHQHQQQRKDSQGSDVGLLSISGRTSRLSSVGSSQGSGGRVSDTSRLSVASGASRSPSPHKMLLETSFCGSRTCLSGDVVAAQSTSNIIVGATSPELETEVLERVLLSRRHDPTEAVLAEGISIECRRKIQPAPVVPLDSCTVESEKSSAQSSPLPTPGKTIVSDSGVEYTFIPLKGPLPMNAVKTHHVPESKQKATEANEPQYIRIKLKPDHMYADINHCGPTPVQKPDSLDLSDGKVENRIPTRTAIPSVRCTPSPISRKNSFVSLFRGNASPESPSTRKRLSLSGDGARSRSKSSDRIGQGATMRSATTKPNHHRSVFALFKPKKTSETSPPPPPLPPSNLGSANAGLSGLAFSFRREHPLEADSIIIPLHSPSEKPNTFTYTNEPETDAHTNESDTVSYIKQHEPVKYSTDSEMVRYMKEPEKIKYSKESQKIRMHESEKVTLTKEPEIVSNTKTIHSEHVVVDRRRSSTSSENLIFSTKLGADNDEVFTTKLTKHDIVAAATGEDRCVTPTKAPVALPVSPAQPNTGENNKVPVSGEGDIEAVDSSEQESEDGRTTTEGDGRREKIVAPADGSDGSGSEHERKGLVLQQDSFEDELPYVPTTLPQERSVAVPMVPIKQRAACEVRTCPIERPRSTTPINPAGCLEAYQRPEDKVPVVPSAKLKISLPWDESGRRSPSRRTGSLPPPPLPPRGASAVNEWVNFEDIPERRKPPKRIQTIPSRATLTLGQPLSDENVVYSYVNPEDCKCECHETGARTAVVAVTSPERREDELPLLLTADRRSDSSLESQTSAPPPPPKKIGSAARAAPSNINPRLTS